MREAMKTVTLYIILSALVSLILLFSMAAPMVTTGADFSIYNTGWNGCSHLGKRVYRAGKFAPNLELEKGKGDMEIAQKELTSYSLSPNSSTMVFLGPDEGFSSDEADYVHEFLTAGGKVLLADDFGSANTLLNKLNTTSRFYTSPVMDLSFEKKPDFGVAYDISEHEITDGVVYLLLNRPTGISPADEAECLVNTTSGSWLDKNEDGAFDSNEKQGGFPILTVEEYGKGELVLLSDPSIMINSMYQRMDNEKLVTNLMDYVTHERNEVIIDESHRDMSVVFTVVYTVRYPSEIVSFLFVVAALIASLFILVPGAKEILWNKVVSVLHYFREEEAEDVFTKVLNNHPEWDEYKLQMIFDRFGEVKTEES